MADKIPASGKIRDDLYLLNLGFVCVYVVEARGALIAFDTGMKPEGLKAQLAAVGLDPRKVAHVFLTHSDRDHVGGLPALPEAKVHMPAAESKMLDRSVARFFGFVYNRPFGREYVALEDGEEMAVDGVSIRCIATPGHTAGHMSYLVNGKLLIAGDLLNIAGGKAVLDRGFINIDNEKRRESMRKLAQLRGVDLLCPMHSGYSRDFDRAMAPWRG